MPLLPCLPQHWSILFFISPQFLLPDRTSCFITDSSQIHISSFQITQQHLFLQFWFSSTMAAQPALPRCTPLCFLGNHCHTTSQKPVVRSSSLLPSVLPWSSMSQVTDFSSGRKTLCKGSGFGLLSV